MINKQELKNIGLSLTDINKRLRLLRIQIIRLRYREENEKTKHLTDTYNELEQQVTMGSEGSQYKIDDLIDQVESILNISF